MLPPELDDNNPETDAAVCTTKGTDIVGSGKALEHTFGFMEQALTASWCEFVPLKADERIRSESCSPTDVTQQESLNLA